MIDLDNFLWNKLSIICYRGGYGGDFLCNLLYQNYSKTHLVNPSNEKNQFNFTYLDTGYMQPCLKNIKDLFFLHKDAAKKKIVFDLIKLTEFDKIKIKRDKSKDINDWKAVAWYDDLMKIYHILYDEDTDIYTENFTNYIREIYYQGYKEKKYISRIHWHHPQYESFKLSKTFLGANIFLLVTDNIIYHDFFMLLSFIKNNQMYYYKLMDDSIFKNIFTNEKEIVKNTFDNMIPIDVGKLFFENGYENEVENILSDSLKKNIVLNKKLLEKYKKDNMNIIENIIGKENMKDLEPNLIAEKVEIFLNERHNKL
jgi:hypothetical protein